MAHAIKLKMRTPQQTDNVLQLNRFPSSYGGDPEQLESL